MKRERKALEPWVLFVAQGWPVILHCVVSVSQCSLLLIDCFQTHNWWKDSVTFPRLCGPISPLTSFLLQMLVLYGENLEATAPKNIFPLHGIASILWPGGFQPPFSALYLCPVYRFPVRLWIVCRNNDVWFFEKFINHSHSEEYNVHCCLSLHVRVVFWCVFFPSESKVIKGVWHDTCFLSKSVIQNTLKCNSYSDLNSPLLWAFF